MIALVLPYPPSLNTYWRHVGDRTLLSREGRQYKRDAADAWKKAGGPKAPEGALAVRLVLYRPRRAGDADNRLKAIGDALNGLVWEDDGVISEWHIYRRDDKTNPRAEVAVWPTSAAAPAPALPKQEHPQ